MSTIPEAAARIDLNDLDVFAEGVPHDWFAWLRANEPVYFQEQPDDVGYWCLTKHADIIAASKDFRRFSSAKGMHIKDMGPGTEHMLINQDPPRHTRLRSLVSHGFHPRMIANLEDKIREVVHEILDNVGPKGECDFVTEIAAELPLQVIAEMIGIPLEDRHLIFKWSNDMIGFDDPEYGGGGAEVGKIASMQMYMYANQLAVERKKSPRDDLVSALMAAEVDGEKLTEVEFDSFFLLLAVAGNETTRNLISGGMLALLQHPAERARLLADPSLLPTAVEEMLRWVSPVMYFRRTATRDTEIGGQPIRAGDKLTVWYGSANRDEEVFPHADRFDVGRTPNDHLAFGIGHHFCLGANLARLEIQIMFDELLRRLPDLEPAGPVERLRSNFINGIKRMPVRFTPERS